MLLDLHRERMQPCGLRTRQDQGSRVLRQSGHAFRWRRAIRREVHVRADEHREPQERGGQHRQPRQVARRTLRDDWRGVRGTQGVQREQRGGQRHERASAEHDAVDHRPDAARREEHGVHAVTPARSWESERRAPAPPRPLRRSRRPRAARCPGRDRS